MTYVLRIHLKDYYDLKITERNYYISMLNHGEGRDLISSFQEG